MKKLILLSTTLLSGLALSSCTVTEAAYTPGYNNDYVYSVGYYGYEPYWNTGFYSGVGWGSNYAYRPGYYGRQWGGGAYGFRRGGFGFGGGHRR